MMTFRPTRFISDAKLDAESGFHRFGPNPPQQLLSMLAQDGQLSRREKRLLTACALMREIYQAELRTLSIDRERVLRDIRDQNMAWRDNALAGRGILSRIYLFFSGEEAATKLDFFLGDELTRQRQRIEERQRDRRREVTEFSCEREERWRAQLSGASGHAKKLFNSISVTGRSITHFPAAELSAARPPAPV
jgi:hypothetical protein